VRGDRVAAAVRHALDRRLEDGVLERLDLAAVVAHEVVVVIATRVGGLEPRDAVSEIDALDDTERVHRVEGAVDTRDPDAAAARTHGVVDLLRREAAVLLAEELDDEPTRPTAPAAGIPKALECCGAPRHGDNDSCSQRVLRCRRMRALVPVLVTLLFAAGCSGGESDSRPTIVASSYPLAWAAQRVAGDGFRVVNLTPAGAEPHDIELSPRDVEAIRDAELVVYLSGGFQPAVEDAVAERDGPSIDARGEDVDPHVWLDPIRFSGVVEELGHALGRPEAASRVEGQLRDIDEQYRTALAHCERGTFVTDHAAFGHLAERYGLTQLSLVGISPEAEPAPRAVEQLVEKVKAAGVPVVFAEPLVSDRLATTVAHEADVEVSFLDPIEGLTSERLDEGDDYASVMLDDLNALAKALGCRQP
jgi:zinc transport system substrate-binding protein